MKTRQLPVPVISVGNLTTGGTGKTPLVSWVCRVLANEGRKVSVLTRGYGRAESGERVLVSDGATILVETARSGDEPQLLARELTGIASVICDADRAAAGRWAIEKLGANAFVLDDGFQHQQLARDLNIVTVDATNPWGGGLLPYGRLREPRRGIARADSVVLTRVDQGKDISALKEEIQRWLPAELIFTSRMRIKGVRGLVSGGTVDINSLTEPIAAFCAVGNPDSFFNSLERRELNLVLKQTFRDHYDYSQSDIDNLQAGAKKSAATSLITTAKDAVKLADLNFDLPCYVLEIEIVIDQPDRLVELIRQTLDPNQSK